MTAWLNVQGYVVNHKRGTTSDESDGAAQAISLKWMPASFTWLMTMHNAAREKLGDFKW